MSPLETLTPHITKAFTENADVKTFQDDFIGAFVRWVRPLFLKDDPAAQTVLTQPGNDSAKQKIIAAKLPALLNDPATKQALLKWAEALTRREKNVLNDAEVDVTGHIKIGDAAGEQDPDPGLSRKNIVEHSKLKGGGDFTLGDTK